MSALNPLAVSNRAFLIAIRDGQWTTKADLANLVGKDAKNISRDLGALESAALITTPEGGGRPILTAYADAQLAMMDRAEGQGDEPGSRGGDPLALSLVHAQILPDPDNAREDWSSDEARLALLSLRMDIVENGLHQNLLVRPMTEEEVETVILHETQDAVLAEGLPLYRLIAGERRWRAIGEALDEGDWPARRLIPCRLFEGETLAQRIAGLSENLQRRDLNPIEKAKGFEALTEAGLTNQDIADRFDKTPEHIQQHRSFLKLSPADQVRMTLPRDDPDRLTVRQARELIADTNRKDRGADPASDKPGAPQAAAVPELEISPIERLMAAEILHAVHRRADYTYDDMEVGPDAAEDLFLSALVEAGMVKAPVMRAHGQWTGRWVISLAYQFPFAAFPGLRAGEAEDFDKALSVERARIEDLAGATADVTDERPYVTAWLNGPFELTTDGQALIDAKTAEEAALAERRAQEAEVRDSVRAAQAAVVARARDLFAQSRVATVAGRVDREVAQEIATSAEAPLPWRVTADGGVAAADGSPVIGGGGTDRGEARMRLLVLAVNAAGGVETPEDEQPEPEQDIDGSDPAADDEDDTDDDDIADDGADD